MKNKITYFLMYVVAIIACSLSVYTQTFNKLSAGIMLGGAFNLHSGTLTTNEGLLDCGTFNGTTSLRWIAGNYANLPLNETWSISPRIYYHKASGSFEADNIVQPLIALSDGTTTTLNTKHSLDVSLDYITLDAIGQNFITDKMYLGLGVSIGIPTRNAFEQYESIISPKGVTFIDGSNTRRIAAGYFTDKQGNIASNTIRIGAVANLGTLIPLSPSFILNPEVSFQYSFLNVISDADWKVHALRGSIGLMYVLETSKLPQPLPAEPPTLPIQIVSIPPAIALLDVQNINSDGSLENYAELTVNNHRTLDILPLLPYIFFEAKTDVLINRYHILNNTTSSNFSEAQLPNNQLDVYHDILNIIGFRMKKYPDAVLYLTGCIEPLDDGNDKVLSIKRAESIRTYLHETWGIANERILVQSRILPLITSNRKIVDGRAENRRVEMTTNDQRILAPVFIKNAKTTISPNSLRLNPTVIYKGAIESVDYSLLDNTGKLLTTTHSNNTESIVLNTTNLNLSDVKSNQVVIAVMSIKTDSGSIVKAERSIPLRRTFTSSRSNSQIVRDTLIERYSLILFNYDRASTISGENDQIMRLIRSRISTNSDVRIDGMTDYIGSEDKNLKLSQARATVVQSSINDFVKPESQHINGLGEVDLFDNTLPEGRFYNRRVFVEIATPLLPDLDEEGGMR
ncbi:MAG: OmpA family protein [Bacteroidetes bacterium]|nr:OmpA family protein [Bacteroidota bacterium]